jgi:hypothetical protein
MGELIEVDKTKTIFTKPAISKRKTQEDRIKTILICIQNFVNLNLQILDKNGITLRNRTL